MSQNSYDEVPYESYPYVQTHPQHLHTIGKVFGLKSPDFKKARVLELGCASGGNIIPLAFEYPKGEFVGIDLSEIQIEEGKKHIANLGLKNIELHTLSILDLDERFGKFDYIICHGVFSWVPQSVQDKILSVCKELLTPKGVALISYNTLPGWNMVKSMRDMMLYHASFFKEPHEKVGQARALLQFVSESMDERNPYGMVIKNELELLKDKKDNYLMHDHMEENNYQLYFHEFMQKASDNGLQYLSDTNLSSMFSGNLSPKAVEALQTVDDIVRQEQYMDFITNRRFRSTILCHQNVKLNRKLNTTLIEDFYIRSFLRPAKEVHLNLSVNENVEFVNAFNQVQLVTHNAIATAVFVILFEQNSTPIRVSDLINQVKDRLKTDDVEAIKNTILEFGTRLVLAGSINLYSDPGSYIVKVSDKPKASELARYQVKYFPWVTNKRHEPLNLTDIQKVVLPLLDGKHDLEALTEEVLKLVENGTLNYSKDGQVVKDLNEIRKDIRAITEQALEGLAPSALLVA
jgi:methyltransferase-like protein/cyclopropane fatty-acyl-phospholipid synthase-like methyltransferase